MNGNDSRTDEEIVDVTRTEDQEQYACLVDRYQHKLLRYALSLLHDEHKAEDVVQEAFIKAFINLNSFDTKKKFSSWLYRIVHNEAMNHLKKHRWEIPFWENFDFASKQNIEEEFAEQELLTALHDRIASLPVLYSAPLSLYYIEEKSYEEISDILHIPMGTVATRMSRAKHQLKKLCQKN